jgi:hypothetical protein
LKKIIQVNKLQPGMDQIDVWRTLGKNLMEFVTSQNVVLKGNTLYVELTSSVLRKEWATVNLKLWLWLTRITSRCRN